MIFHRKFHDCYFTSDTHRNHKNICRGTSQWDSNYRDFDTLDEMNAAIDNSLVFPKGSILFHLGDTIFGDKSLLPDFVNHMRETCAEVHLIYGNHDKFIRKNPLYIDLFDSVNDYVEIICKGRLFCLSHYPLSEWPECANGSYMIHGHCHGNLKDKAHDDFRILDVGWEIWTRPLHADEIIEKLDNRPNYTVGHHA